MTDITRERIETRLKDLNLSMNAASEQAGIDRSYLGKFLKGEIKRPSLAKIEAVALALKCSPDYLLGRTSVTEEGPAAPAGGDGSYDVPVVGIVESFTFRPAGWAQTQNLGVIPNALDPAFLGERQFAYLVRGHDMNLAGIVDGSIIICVDPWASCVQLYDGAYVVAETTRDTISEFIVRKLLARQNSYELVAHSTVTGFPVIRLGQDADLREGSEHRILGVVTTLLCRFTVRRAVGWTSGAAEANQSAEAGLDGIA